MSVNAPDSDFGEYDKPGAERSRRRRGDDDDMDSDLEEGLLEEDWLTCKKNPSEISDEELNDDLLQSDEEDDQNLSSQDQTFNVTFDVSSSYDQQENSQEADDADDVVNLGTEGYDEGGYQQEEYTEDYSQDESKQMPDQQMDCFGELDEGDGYQDEVLNIEINEPLDGEFQDDDFLTSYAEEPSEEQGVQEQEALEDVVEGEEQQKETNAAEAYNVIHTDEAEHEAVPQKETKEDSDEEDEEDEESGHRRFKSERKEGVTVRLADAGTKRKAIPETLELSEKAKAELKEFEDQQRQKRQTQYGGRGRGGWRGRGRGGFQGFGMGDYRCAGENRGRMNDQRHHLMANLGMQQPPNRMPGLHQHHHPLRTRGPPPFQEHGRPIAQQPLQPLIPPPMAHRSPPLRPQLDPPPSRMMISSPPSYSQHHQQQQQQPPQPKNIHINPHFRGPSSSSVQVPLMPPAQSQPRPAVGPQRFPGPGEFQQHIPGNFGQPQRPPHHMEPYRNQPPQGLQDREPLFMGEPARFPGQHMFDHQSPSPLMNNSNSLHQQPTSQGHMGFGPPGPGYNHPGQGPLGLFPREPPRPNLPPHQSHQGMVGLNQQGGPPNQPRPFMGPRQPFGQQSNIFPPPQYGMQVRLRSLMHSPPGSQMPHHEPPPSHQPMQHHRQELPQHHHLSHNESRPMMHHGQNPFHHQQPHGSPRQMTPRPQNLQQRNSANRQRMSAPVSKQMQSFPKRNSNLRELPVAPGNTNMNSAHPTASPSANVRPVARATQGVRPGQNIQPVPGNGRGRGQVNAKTESQPRAAGRTVVRKEILNMQSSALPQDPNEDEETRQYRLKIEEQKRLREEILKRKEMRRQMQAGVRKKELLERLNQSQSSASSQIQSVPQNQQIAPPVQQQQQLQQQQQQQQQQLEHRQQQQRPFPQRTQQPANQLLKNPNQGTRMAPNSGGQAPAAHPNVKTRLQTAKGGIQQQQQQQQQQTPGSFHNQQWQQQNPEQQQRTSTVQILNKPGTQPPGLVTRKNQTVPSPLGAGQVQTQGPKPGVKRTVMQRSKSTEAQQVPQKVRVVKLSGAGGKLPEATSSPLQPQGSQAESPINTGFQRTITMTGQAQQGSAVGETGNPQQNRVVVSGRGRGRGGGQMGRGRPIATRQSQRSAESQRCVVSIEGLSSSTTDTQLKNLLRSIGPIEMFKMIPQQRKALAKFSTPQHAESFQMSFNRHMIDLSHIDVSLIDG